MTENNEDKPIVGKVTGMKPSVVNGRRAFPKVNTAKPSSRKARAEKAIVGMEKHCEQHPNDGRSSARLSVLRGML